MTKSEGFEVLCDNCSTDLSNLVAIRCAECKDEEYDLCVPCFASGAASKNHKPWHDYIVIEQQAYPIFTNDWGADEELLLIEGLEQFGIGSWQDVAEHIGRRTKEEVEEHYKAVYLDSSHYPVPHVVDHPLSDDMSEFMEKRRKRLEKFNAHQQLIKAEQSQQRQVVASVPACHEIQGFMPGRLEFETEAENDAEMAVKNMIFEPDDSELDIELKLAVLAIYNSRLERRTERKRTIFSHGLTEYRKLAAQEKRRTKEERELLNKLKPFVRLLPHDEYERFTEDMLAEQQYRQRIAELQEYRQMGIRKLAQAQKYEKEKQLRHNSIFRTSQPPVSQRQSFFEAELNAAAHSSQGGGGGGHAAATNGGAYHSENEPLTIKIRKITGVPPLDVSQAPDVDLLSPQEKSLCTQLRIYPKAYLAIKEAVFQAMLRNGGTMKRKLMRDLLSHVDELRVGRIYDFFQMQNWIG